MKRILSIFIITFIFSNAAGAVCDINVQNANDCNTRAGCIWDGSTCTYCSLGTYNNGQLPESGANIVKCASCPTSTIRDNNTMISTIGTTSASGGKGAPSKNQCTQHLGKYSISWTTTTINVRTPMANGPDLATNALSQQTGRWHSNNTLA